MKTKIITFKDLAGWDAVDFGKGKLAPEEEKATLLIFNSEGRYVGFYDPNDKTALLSIHDDRLMMKVCKNLHEAMRWLYKKESKRRKIQFPDINNWRVVQEGKRRGYVIYDFKGENHAYISVNGDLEGLNSECTLYDDKSNFSPLTYANIKKAVKYVSLNYKNKR